MMTTQVLLLNASYEPLSALPLARALNLWLRGRVDAVCDECVALHASSQTIEVPCVLRLKVFRNVPNRRAPLWSRRALMARDNFTCAYCGKREAPSALTIDHVIPKCQGGRTTWGNTVAACYACNQRKDDRSPHEAGMRLQIEPKTPRVSYLVASGDVPAAWKYWLEL